jgi:hypothetical protein
VTIYNELQKLTQSVLQEFKQGSVYLIKVTEGSGAEDNPGQSTEVKYLMDAVVRGVSKKYQNMSFVLMSDLEVTASMVNSVIPSEKDFIEIDGNRFKIMQDVSVPASDTRVVWKFIVRRGG